MHDFVSAEIVFAVLCARGVEVGQAKTVAILVGKCSEAVALASELVVDNTVGVNGDVVLYMRFVWRVL